MTDCIEIQYLGVLETSYTKSTNVKIIILTLENELSGAKQNSKLHDMFLKK